MLLLFLLAFCVAALGAFGIPRPLSRRCDDLLSRDVTSYVNGFFIVLVFLKHGKDYVPVECLSGFDNLYLATVDRIGQMIVTTFLMYSGYGAMESICSKERYAERMPTSRILPFVLDVAIALVPYAVFCAARGQAPTLDYVLLALVGRKSLGNSNWYIFAILCMWAITWVAFKVAKKPWQGLGLVVAGTLAYVLVLWMDNPVEGTRWYNTIFCYPAGMALSLLLRRFGAPSLRRCICGIAVCAVVFVVAYFSWEPYILMYNARSIAFALAVTLAVMNVRYLSVPFVWAGRNLFYLYIYHRLALMLLRPLAQFGTLIYFGASVLLLLGWCLIAPKVHIAARKLVFG